MSRRFEDDGEAWKQLGDNFTDDRGMIRNIIGYKPTDDDFVAIDYLCNEWDYSWELK
jgi:hypothetical protein